MDRRTLLRRAGTAVAVALAGCSEGREGSPRQVPAGTTERGTPTPPGLVVPAFDWEEGDEGELVVVVTVSNTLGAERTGTVRVTVSSDEDEYTNSRSVTVPGGANRTIRVGFDVPYNLSTRGEFGIDFSVEG